MLQSGSSAEEQRAYLKRRGWVHLKVDHAWEWQLPPAPGQHRLEDAVAVQLSMDKAHKSKGKSTVT